MSAVRRPQQHVAESVAPKKLRVIAGGKSPVTISAEKNQIRSKFHYAVIIMLGLVVVLAGQLIMSIFLAQGAYEITALKGDLREASRTAESLGEDIALLSSPQYLASNATAMGMVPSKNVAFLRLSDGKVSGALSVAGAANAIANPQVTNSLLEKEAGYLTGVLGLTQVAGGLEGDSPLGLPLGASEPEVSSSEATRGLTPVNTETPTEPSIISVIEQ